MQEFDIVIPVGPCDFPVLQNQIGYTKRNVVGYRKVYLVCKGDLQLEGCTTVDERLFPFDMETVAKFHGKRSRNGWYLQQLLKLYSGFFIPGILKKYLVIDCDTFFLKPTEFFKDSKCLYNFSYQNHQPYFDHMLRLDNKLIKVCEKSGICHHMMFETCFVLEMMKSIETKHGDAFYNIFLKEVIDVDASGASEYEIYFNYMLKNHPEKITLRPLRMIDTGTFDVNVDLDYISYHHYLR
jgi:hypothetical protein